MPFLHQSNTDDRRFMDSKAILDFTLDAPRRGAAPEAAAFAAALSAAASASSSQTPQHGVPTEEWNSLPSIQMQPTPPPRTPVRQTMVQSPPPPVSSPMAQTQVCDSVIFCFNAMPREVTPELRGSAPSKQGYGHGLVMWALETLGDKYKHVECLFHYKGDPNNRFNWRALTAFEKTGSGVYLHSFNYYKDGRWDCYRLVDVPHAMRLKLYEFATRENDNPRSYQQLALLNTVPSTSWLGSCTTCCAPPQSTVYCTQLMVELMKYAYPEVWRDVSATGIRPDGFLKELLRRHKAEIVVLDLIAPNQRVLSRAENLIQNEKR